MCLETFRHYDVINGHVTFLYLQVKYLQNYMSDRAQSLHVYRQGCVIFENENYIMMTSS